MIKSEKAPSVTLESLKTPPPLTSAASVAVAIAAASDPPSFDVHFEAEDTSAVEDDDAINRLSMKLQQQESKDEQNDEFFYHCGCCECADYPSLVCCRMGQESRCCLRFNRQPTAGEIAFKEQPRERKRYEPMMICGGRKKGFGVVWSSKKLMVRMILLWILFVAFFITSLVMWMVDSTELNEMKRLIASMPPSCIATPPLGH